MRARPIRPNAIQRSTPALVLGALALGLCLFFAAATPGLALDPVVCVDEGQFIQPPQAPPVVAVGVPEVGAIYEGATPPGLDPDRPVLVFVHGLHGSVASWTGETEYYGHNDMYDTAYAAGYKTFFVELWDAQGEAKTSVRNGRLLANLLKTVTKYWGVESVNLIAHSKGGPDANVAALVSEGLVDTVFTLSGAHWGSPLADLAQSSWAGWLAELLGFNDEGTKFLQTACMAWFRDQADWRPFNNRISIYTAAATGWGPALSNLGFAGLYLAGACPGSGDNDGLVCIDHAEHPWARDPSGTVTGEHRLIWDAGGPDYEADHDNVRMGNAFMDFTWPWEPDDCYIPIFESIEPYIGVFNSTESARPLPNEAGRRRAPHQTIASDRDLIMMLRGGAIDGSGALAVFPVESEASMLAVSLLVGHRETGVVLRSPGGRSYDLPAPEPAGGDVFRGAFGTGIQIDRPEPGEWRLELVTDVPSAFVFLGTLDSELTLRLSIEPDAAGRQVVSVRGRAAHDLHLEGELKSAPAGGSGGVRIERLEGSGDRLVIEPGARGVSNLSLTIRGSAADGRPFERSAVISLPSDSASRRLPELCK